MERGGHSFFNSRTFWVLAAIALGVLWRLPLYLNAEHLLWSDEAANLLTVKHLLNFGEPYYFYHGMRYQGLTESLLSLLFVPFFGFSALSQKLAGSVVYLAFAVLAARFFFTYVTDRFLRFLFVAFLVFPTNHLFHTSFMAYGGHLLNALLGFCLLYAIFHFHSSQQTRRWVYPLSICGIIAVGVYTYRHFLSFYPALALMVLMFRGGLPLLSRENLRNVLFIGGFALLCPTLNQRLGEWIQSHTFETMNSFMTFQSFQFIGWQQLGPKIAFVFSELWSLFFTANIHERFRTVGFVLGIGAITVLFAGTVFTWKRKSDLWRLYRVSVFHFSVVFASVIVTPYAITPMDLRYLMPLYSVAPFILTALLTLTQGIEMRTRFRWETGSALALFITFGIVNTILYNNFLGTQSGLAVVRQSHDFGELIQYLRQEKVSCIFMEYSDAYRLSLVTDEKIVASGTHLPRIRRYEECAAKQTPRIIALRNGHEEIPMFLSFKPKHALRYRVRTKLSNFTVLESATD